MTLLRFTIPGEPQQKDRARAVPSLIWKDGVPEAIVRLVTSKQTREAERHVRACFHAAHPRHRKLFGPVMLSFTAIFQTPVSFNRALQAAARAGNLYATKKPDKDNIEKMIVDSLNGLAWGDDSQVMGGGIKRYGSPARIEVSIRSLEDPLVPPTPGQRRAEKQDGQPPAQLPLLRRAARPADKHNALSASERAVVNTGDRPPADLSGFNDKQRSLIERALEREERSRRTRGH